MILQTLFENHSVKNISYVNIVSGYGISKLRKIIIIKTIKSIEVTCTST